MQLLGKLSLPFLFFVISSIFSTPVFAIEDITGTWSASVPLPYALASHASLGMGGKTYIIGGSASTGNSQKNIIYSSHLQNGGVNEWQSAGDFPTAPIFHTSVKSNDYAYILGGREENSGSINDFVPKVFYAKIENGELGSWVEQTPLPQKLGLGAAVISGDKIYFAGGFNSSIISDKLYSAPLNPDGSIGEWTDISTLPDNLFGLGMVEHESNLYVIGGRNSVLPTEYVYRASINPDGSVSSWEIENPLPQALYRPSVIKVGNMILVVGGESSGGSQKTIYYTTINPDGSLDSWQESSNKLPAAVHGGSISLVNKYLYLVGGFRSGEGYLNSVYYTKLDIDTTPSEIGLNVPLFMQIDPAWGGQIYDSALSWSPSSPGISAWGCVVTSAAMVFNYHNITKLPNNLDLNPGNLNAWLKSQPDGYVGSGLVNWLALSRLSKQAKSKNPQFTYDALEYKRVNGFNPDQLRDDLKNNIPGILEVPGHFVVGKGTVNTSFTINDPYYVGRTNLEPYSNTFLTLSRFIPSNTDLSYIMFIVEDGILLSVKDQNGNAVGEGFVQQPLQEDEGSLKSGAPMFMYYITQPVSGQYEVEVSGNKQYSLQTFFYDTNGEVKVMSTNGVVRSGGKDAYTISFNKENILSSNTVGHASFDGLLSDIEYFYSVNKIKSRTLYVLLREEVEYAKKVSQKNKKLARAAMGLVITQLDLAKKKLITEEAHKILRTQALELYNFLK